MTTSHRRGQRHDRIPSEEPNTGGPPLLPGVRGRKVAAADVSLSQRMLSAVTGSVLTSLLGMLHPEKNLFQTG